MTLKQNIISDINNIVDPSRLHVIYELLQNIKLSEKLTQTNTNAVLEHAGVISNEESREIEKDIEDEFNNIEGDW